MVCGVLAVSLGALAAIALWAGPSSRVEQLRRNALPLVGPVDPVAEPHDVANLKPDGGERVLFHAAGEWRTGELIDDGELGAIWWDGSSAFQFDRVRWWLELPPDPPV